jgi:hypothetical protein
MTSTIVSPTFHHRTVNWVILSIVLGAVSAFTILGWNILNPLNINWLNGDRAMHYLGWAFLRQETIWYFPPTWTTRLGYPIGLSVSFTDCLPLIAVLLRPFQALLPNNFQYLGLYSLACFILQFYFAFQLARRLLPNSAMQILMAGIMLALAPVYLTRLALHVPFAFQWLILACLAAYFAPCEAGNWRWYRPLVIFAALAGAIQLYLAFLVCSIALTGALRMRLERRSGTVKMFGFTGAAVGACACTAWLFGFLGTNAGYAGEGYGYYSFNLLSPINPQPLGADGGPSVLLPSFPIFAGQYEGYAYLGAGVILLLIIGIAARPRTLLDLASPTIAPLLILSLALTALSASTTVTIGPIVIGTIALPDVIVGALSAFRASGRLFWPVYYLIILGAVVLIVRAFETRRAVVILCAAMLLQLCDMAYLMKDRVRVFHNYPGAAATGLVAGMSPVWRNLGQYQHLVVLPAAQCDVQSPGGADGFQIFGLIALENRMTINSYKIPRRIQGSERFHCVEQVAKVERGELASDTAYVLNDDMAQKLFSRSLSIHTFRCERVDGYNLCVKTNSQSGAWPAGTAP